MPEVTGRFEIKNRLGMHARSAAAFVQLANRYKSEIRLSKGDVEANGKSIMGVLQLGAAQGEVIEVWAKGDDCLEMLRVLGELVDNRFGEDE